MEIEFDQTKREYCEVAYPYPIFGGYKCCATAKDKDHNDLAFNCNVPDCDCYDDDGSSQPTKQLYTNPSFWMNL